MKNIDAARTDSRRAIETVYLHTRRLLRTASDVRDRRASLEGRLATLGTDAPIPGAGDSGRRAVVALVPAVLIAIFVVEWLLASPTAGWFSITLLGSPAWVPVLNWLLPTAVFMLEILVAVQLDEEAERRGDGQEGPRVWLTGAILLALVMPLFSMATQLAIVPEAPELLPMFWARTLALVLLAFVLHGTVLASGRLIRGSLGWWSFTATRSWLRIRASRLRRTDRRVTAAALARFTIYRRLRATHHHFWPEDTLPLGPWDSAAHLVIGEDLAASGSAVEQQGGDLMAGLGHPGRAKVPSLQFWGQEELP